MSSEQTEFAQSLRPGGLANHSVDLPNRGRCGAPPSARQGPSPLGRDGPTAWAVPSP
jgi:hypothetical protein